MTSIDERQSRASPMLRHRRRRRTSPVSLSVASMPSTCLIIIALLHLAAAVQASADTFRPTHRTISPSPTTSTPAKLDERANFWAGWPTTTVTVIETEVRTGDAVVPTPTPIPTEVIPFDTDTITTTLWNTAGDTVPVTVYYTTTTTTQISEDGGDGTRTTTTTAARPSSTTTSTWTAQATATSSAPVHDPWDERDIPRFATCEPGDEDYVEPGVLSLTQEQVPTLAAMAVMFLVILIGWNFAIIRYLLYPLKMMVVIIHEGGHVVSGVLTGNQLERVYPDPTEGGLSVWTGPYPIHAIPCGYLFSILVGCAFVVCGFNTQASKVASFFIGILFVVVTCHALSSPATLVLIALSVGLMIAFWFIEHARYLRYYVLFVGVMSCWYLLWDFLDDWVFHKPNACCLILHAERLGPLPPFVWLWIWFGITSLFFSAFIIIGVYAYRQSPHSMFCQGQGFLPT